MIFVHFLSVFGIILLLRNSSPAKLLEMGSHLLIQYLGLQSCILSAIYNVTHPAFYTHTALYQ